MAKKRMFNLSVVDSDAFLDMPLSSQCLYFHLNMRADDDGFIGNPKRIQREVGCSEDDLKILLAKRFILIFEDGVIVIKHWRMHNTIQKDRYIPTVYQDELNMLGLKENKAYTFSGKHLETKCIQNVSPDIDIGIDKDIDIVLDNNNNIAQSFVRENDNVFIQMPLNDNSLFDLYDKQVKEFKELYQNVDIDNELKKAKAWLISNPTKRKTKKGIMRFINNWLSRAQDRGIRNINIKSPNYDDIDNSKIQISDEEYESYFKEEYEQNKFDWAVGPGH